jgi:hypothetical protein
MPPSVPAPGHLLAGHCEGFTLGAAASTRARQLDEYPPGCACSPCPPGLRVRAIEAVGCRRLGAVPAVVIR